MKEKQTETRNKTIVGEENREADITVIQNGNKKLRFHTLNAMRTVAPWHCTVAPSREKTALPAF